MTNHLSEDELILHYYGEVDRADAARVASHLASCADCQAARERLARVMAMVDTAAPVEAPPGFERIAWARLEPELVRRSAKREGGWFAFPQWALAGGVAALVLAAFVAGRFTGNGGSANGTPAGIAAGGTPAGVTAGGTPVGVIGTEVEPQRVLRTAVGDHLDRTQIMLVELANADTDHADVLASEQARASDLVAVNRVIRASAEQSGDAAIVDVLEDLERVLLEIANAPANASSNDLTDLQSRITTQDLLFRLRVIASEMRQRTINDREAGDPSLRRTPRS